jgi:hypothetical protein
VLYTSLIKKEGFNIFAKADKTASRLGILLCAHLVACETDTNSPPVPQPDSQTLFSAEIKTVELEIDYVEGAEPYTGEVGDYSDLWALFRANATRLMPGKKIVCPSAVSDMELLQGEGGGNYSTTRILDIAGRHRDLENTATKAVFYGIWLDGYYEDEYGTHEDVLGANIGDTGVIAMFKPVLAASEELPTVVRFGEQTTFIHEFGHALGLVNVGIPLASEHEDSEHPGHCSNTDCAMYWANDQILSLIEFAKNFVDTGDPVVFGSECLDDVDAFSNQMTGSKNQ